MQQSEQMASKMVLKSLELLKFMCTIADAIHQLIIKNRNLIQGEAVGIIELWVISTREPQMHSLRAVLTPPLQSPLRLTRCNCANAPEFDARCTQKVSCASNIPRKLNERPHQTLHNFEISSYRSNLNRGQLDSTSTS
ncbi:unnamed protein product [Hymenolepis diminuta]|uniref:Uncharacterized protein n=1 Tax=Hymenolepis diminuta TaxID=6216 RepID=A0A564YPG2_HYMDI|nr:unnamed protein product [Hymenolepis diminuta]